MALQLYPWRDGYETTKRRLQERDPSTRTVRISFSEYEFQEYLQDADVIRLFEEIGSNPKFESVTIEMDVFSELPTSVAIPPIPALTSLLMAHDNRIRDLTLSQLQLESLNDLDINGMVEAFRIHPTLQSVEVKNCTFSKPSHLHRLRKTLVQREGIKHCDLLNNRISFSKDGVEEKIDYEQYLRQGGEEEWPDDEVSGSYEKRKQSFWRWSSINYPRFSKICLFCFSCVGIFLAARLLQKPALWNHYSRVPHLPFSMPSLFPSTSNLMQHPSQEPLKQSNLLSSIQCLWKDKDDGEMSSKKKGRWGAKRNKADTVVSSTRMDRP